MSSNNPLGSTSVSDMFLNAGNLDKALNGNQDTWIDRFGVERVSWNYIEKVTKTGELSKQAREALRRSYAEAGLNMVDGSFEKGGILVNSNDVLLHEATGKCYSGNPGTVAPGTLPTSGGFVDKSESLFSGIINKSFPVDITDFLPVGFVTDGSVDYTEIVNHVLSTYTKKRPILFPNFPILVASDQNTGIAITVPSGAHIIFRNNSGLILKPNNLQNYSVVAIHDKEDIFIENLKISADKYTHTGTLGEWGMGLSIRGDCRNIRFNNTYIDACWGDGIYIGQTAETVESTPKDVYFFGKTILTRNRRQGVSLISAENLYFQSLGVYGTRSDDSSTLLPNGPCAGIDIEPNSVNSILRGIKIDRLHGGNNAAGLFYIFLGAVVTTGGNRYHVDIQIDSVTDDGSAQVVSLMGLNKDSRYSGGIIINSVIGNNNGYSPITVRNWPVQCRLPVNIGVASLNNWKSLSSNPARYRSAVSIYQANETGYPKIGNLGIGTLNLTTTVSTDTLYQSAIFAENMGSGLSDVSIGIGYISATKLLIAESCGPINLQNLGDVGSKIGRVITGSTQIYNNVQGDDLIVPAGSNPTIACQDVIDPNYIGLEKRLEYRTSGSSTYFRLRSQTVPLFVNGIQGLNFLFNELSGKIVFKVRKAGYFVTCEGSYIKES